MSYRHNFLVLFFLLGGVGGGGGGGGGGGSDGAMVLGKLQVVGCPTIWITVEGKGLLHLQ